MRNTTRKTLLKALLTTTSAMALSIGAAKAGVMISDHTSTPFTFGDKEVVFTTEDQQIGALGLTALLDGDIGFRISFPAPPVVGENGQDVGLAFGVSNRTAMGGGFSFGQTSHNNGVEFTVTAGPMFKIIGAVLAADAGVMASYDYTANGEDGENGSGSASAAGDIDIELTETTNPFAIDLNDVYDTSVGNNSLDTSPAGDSANTTGMEMVMDSLTAATTYTFSLDWAVTTDTECDLSSFNADVATCVAETKAVINHVDIRFKQMRMAVPEPGTLALFGLGLAGLGFARRKRAV